MIVRGLCALRFSEHLAISVKSPRRLTKPALLPAKGVKAPHFKFECAGAGSV